MVDVELAASHRERAPASHERKSGLRLAGGRIMRVERAVCATGTAWGLLRDQPPWVLMMYWAFRCAPRRLAGCLQGGLRVF